jgi:hypothetical protein
MVALRCGGGAAAYMAAPRITAPENGDGRFGTLTVRARIRELPLRTVVSIFPRFALANSTINLGWLLNYVPPLFSLVLPVLLLGRRGAASRIREYLRDWRR